jgi:hypothetical protein
LIKEWINSILWVLGMTVLVIESLEIPKLNYFESTYSLELQFVHFQNLYAIQILFGALVA